MNPVAASREQTHFFAQLEGERLVCWFSCGATSAVACKIALAENACRREAVVAYCDTGSEHPDNRRFLRECEQWLGTKIAILRHPSFRTVDDVFERERYLNGPQGAKCTQQLKIRLRKKFQRAETDLQVFGFDANEVDRAFDFRRAWSDVNLYTPLIRRGLTKADCLAMLREVGIALPAMYRLGYRNNNCLGCVKGGKGYWNRIRRDFPEVFARRAAQERMIGRSCMKGVFLDELSPNAGRYEAEPDIACEGVCVDTIREVEACE